MRATRFAFIAAVLVTYRAGAQTGTVAGSVARDSAGHMISQAQVRLPLLNRTTSTNYLGEFRLNGVPVGTHVLSVRAVGFAPFADSVVVTAGGLIDREIILVPLAQAQPEASVTLDTVKTHAEGRKFVSPGLQAFEERRLAHQGGYFVSDSLLRANEMRRLGEVLSNIPGVVRIPARGATYLAAARSSGDGGPIFQSKPNTPCFVSVYIDGAKLFQAPSTSTNPPPDFNLLPASEFSGAEYYSGAASMPPQFNQTGSSCGTLLLWTRER
jgi:Carboxypeptidase regulatory-like domain